jgi:hypothetical protein
VKRGPLGAHSFSAAEGDQAAVAVRLSRPAFAYLVAFRPDGEPEVLAPEDEAAPPPKSDRLAYPVDPAAEHLPRYGFTDGIGLYVFAVFVSDTPLPAYRDWPGRQSFPVVPAAAAEAGTVWRFAGSREEPVGSWDGGSGTRGKGQKALEGSALSQFVRRVEAAAPGCAVSGLAVVAAPADR